MDLFLKFEWRNWLEKSVIFYSMENSVDVFFIFGYWIWSNSHFIKFQTHECDFGTHCDFLSLIFDTRALWKNNTSREWFTLAWEMESVVSGNTLVRWFFVNFLIWCTRKPVDQTPAGTLLNLDSLSIFSRFFFRVISWKQKKFSWKCHGNFCFFLFLTETPF